MYTRQTFHGLRFLLMEGRATWRRYYQSADRRGREMDMHARRRFRGSGTLEPRVPADGGTRRLERYYQSADRHGREMDMYTRQHFRV